MRNPMRPQRPITGKSRNRMRKAWRRFRRLQWEAQRTRLDTPLIPGQTSAEHRRMVEVIMAKLKG